MSRWVARLGALLSALVVLAVTLMPGTGPAAAESPWCLVCGERAAADLIRNILLFVPLGVTLGLSGPRARWVVGSAALLSLAIELSQTLIPGRDPSLADLASNTLGAAFGAWAAGAPLIWLMPAPRRAARLAAAWCAMALAMAGVERVLMQPSLPVAPYYGQYVPVFGNMAWYGGSVRRVRLGARPIGGGALDSSLRVRAALLAGDTLVVEAMAGPATGALAPIFSIADDRGRGIVLVGADGEDLVLHYRTRAEAWRLVGPNIRFRRALRETRGGDVLVIRVAHLGPALCLELNGHRACPRMDPRAGWAFIVPEAWLGANARRAANALWTAGLVLPACYWLALALRRAR